MSLEVSAASETRSALRLGVVVPCRNEAQVVARRVANLAGLEWPDGEHRVLVVDDQSDDDTLALAQGAIEQARFPPRVRAEAFFNAGRGGKAGAVQAALERLGCAVDVVLLTDADVVFAPATLGALVAAFAREPELGMACGEQTFVDRLATDGLAPGVGGPAAPDAGGRYDHWTARVREFESLRGRLFSVHGQCLAWRRSLELTPTAGIAADDIDLMLQARAAGARVRLVEGARFFEVKSARGGPREGQALRRAQAYFQVFQRSSASGPRALGSGPWNTLQWWAYRYLPAATPWLVLMLVLLSLTFLLLAAASGHLSWWFAGGLILAGAALAFVPAVRDALRLLWVIQRAHRSSAALDDRWEMPRA